MRAQGFDRHGGPEVIQAVELPLPQPGPGQVRIRVHAAGVNFIDTYHRTGLYPVPLPCVPGIEVSGTVDALGEGVTSLAVGQPVATPSAVGGYAEFALAPASQTAPLPRGVDAGVAAALMVQGLTAHYLTHSTYPLSGGDTCLIHAAAGGTGLLLVQLAKAAGARVLATVGSAAKAPLARDAGADLVVVQEEGPWLPAVRAAAPVGVDVVYDSVGASTFEGSLDALRPRGMLVSFGNASGPVPAFAPLLLSRKGSLFLTRPTLAHHIATPDEFRWRCADLLGRASAGQLRVRIGARLPLEEAARAHAELEARATTGKVLLEV